MNLILLFKKIQPYVQPYKWLVVLTLILTLIGSFIAQINAVVLDRTVDAINELIMTHDLEWKNAAHILTIISIILLGKEVLSAIITYAQNYFGEKMRINVSKDLSQAVIDHMLTYRMSFFSRQENETGKLQTRIDQGVGSLSSTVQNFFIDLLPLFTSAVLALILMFAANFYVGLTALFIVPVYIWITIRQARRLQGWRRNMRHYREQKSHGVTIFALKSNMLYDAVSAVNFALEIPFNERYSILYEHHCPWWLSKDNKHCLQFLSFGAEARWWFLPRPREATPDLKRRDALMGHFIGAYGWTGKSDIQWGRDFGCYQFEFCSAGLTYGFAFPVSKYLNLEFSISAGYAQIPYQHYIPTEDWQILIRDKSKAGTLHYFGPTKAEISLVIPFRKQIYGKGGAR